MAGLAQLFGAVSSSGVGQVVRTGAQAAKAGLAVKGAVEGVEDAKKLLETALNEDEYLRNGTTKDYIKKLNSDVVDFVENIPVIGESISVLGTPLKMAYDAFIDDVLGPIFFNTEAEEKALERRRDYTQWIAERSLAKYGYVMTPQEWQAAEFEQLKERTERRNQQRAEEMEAFRKKAEEAGFKTTAEYSVAARNARKEEIKEDLKELGYNSPREYIDARREQTKKIREERRKAGRGVIPRSPQPVPTPEPITYENPRTSPFVAPIRPTPPAARPGSNVNSPFSTLVEARQSQFGIVPGLTPFQFSGVRPR